MGTALPPRPLPRIPTDRFRYFIAQWWLEDFAFSIALRWWYFAGAGGVALLIAWFTIGLQVVKAARVNPAECLWDE